MADRKQLQQVVERALAQVLDRQLATLQAELTDRVLAEMSASESLPAAGSESSGSGLISAISAVRAGTTQKEILRALLDAAGSYATRVALFVIKAGMANGWQSRGFGDDEAVKDVALDMSTGPAAHAYQNHAATPGNIAEMDGRFVERFGGPANEQVLVLPLLLKEKVAALLYADGGSNGMLDAAALELLVMSASMWLEVTSLRKQAQREAAGAGPSEERPVAAPIHTVSSYADPFAAHALQHVAATPAPEPGPEVVEVSAHAAAASAAASAPATAADPFAGMPPEEADTHRKAQRFARLLVDEIKLYNQAKVAEGRRSKDLYDRLKDDIEKSRASYQKRYGSTAAAAGDYFQKEIVRSLAEDDISVMGTNFHK